MEFQKGKSPFYPGQPVPLELFTGRQLQIDRIERAIKQVTLGKPQSIYLTGDYGIGKSSLASFVRALAEKRHNLFGIHVLLGSAENEIDLASKTVKAVLETESYEPNKTETVRNFLAKYIGNQQIFGLTLNFDALKKDAPDISRGFLPFLREILNKLQPSGTKGIVLILDELNGITKNPQFAYFIKNLVDENALSASPLPLLLMLCGVEERRKEMVLKHQPVDRIFEIIKIEPLNNEEQIDFYQKSFTSVGCKTDPAALQNIANYTGGFPKAMHIIGNNVFWLDKDNVIDMSDAVRGIVSAAKEIGEQFVDDQVYKELKSKDYQSILKKLGKENFDIGFDKSEIEGKLNEAEKKKFNNFLQKMKKLNVLKSGTERGEYIFSNRLIRLYIRMNSVKE